MGHPPCWGERFLRVMGGLFGYLGAPVQALGSIRGLSRKKMPYVLGALLVCVPTADGALSPAHIGGCAVRQVTRRAADWLMSIWRCGPCG